MAEKTPHIQTWMGGEIYHDSSSHCAKSWSLQTQAKAQENKMALVDGLQGWIQKIEGDP